MHLAATPRKPWLISFTLSRAARPSHKKTATRTASIHAILARYGGGGRVDLPVPGPMLSPMIRLLDRAVGVIALTAFLFAATVAQAGEPFAFETTPGRLPKTVVPIHYTLDLRPNLDKLSVSGSVTIEIDVREATDRI